MTGLLRVLVADAYAVTRMGVRHALEGDDCEVVGEAADAETAIARAVALQPDVCLLDVHMPGGGVAAAAAVLRQVPGTTVVMLADVANDEDLFEALRVGAAGYLLKGMDPSRLAYALHGVVAGEAALPRELVARVLAEFRRRPRRQQVARQGPAAQLTDRENEVFDLLSQGLPTDEVARRLFLSPVTVRGHVSTVLRKLRVTSRAEALAALAQD